MVLLTSKIKPFIKWAGGKSQILPEIRQFYPAGLGTTIVKYAEPFIGGGAVLLDILSTYQMQEVFISDINAELIHLYCAIRDNVNELIELASQYQEDFLPLDSEQRKCYYYAKRAHFNELKHSSSEQVEIAALFLFLNKTCFNGLYRVNSQGDYNVPMGAYKAPIICDADNLIQISQLLAGVQIVHGDYHVSKDFIDNKTFAYFDPPYRPLTKSANFTSYSETCFDDHDQQDLAQFINALVDKGAYILASNSDPKNINPDDDFFDNLYAPFTIQRISAMRMINSNGSGRGSIHELLIHNKRSCI